jgi:hypothetical protein
MAFNVARMADPLLINADTFGLTSPRGIVLMEDNLFPAGSR